MVRFERSLRFGGLFVAACFSLTACGTGPERGSIQVVMTASGAPAVSVSPAFSIAGAAGDVSAVQEARKVRPDLSDDELLELAKAVHGLSRSDI